MSTPSTSGVPSNDPAAATRPPPSWWSRLHFSGRVIMCSIFLGFGLVLIGGVVFASSTVDEDSPSLNGSDGDANAIPTKAPSSMVGTVVMGIGTFVTVVGVMMCLVETQVCRRKKRDPLIPDGASDVGPSVQQPQKRDKAKPGTPQGKVRGSHGKCSKGKHKKKKDIHPSQYSKSVAVPIVSPRNALTSSGEVFLTPSDTLIQNIDSTFGSPLEAGSRPLESSAYYSSGQWSKSSEFHTPCASFTDSSALVARSTEVRAAVPSVEASKVQGNADLGNFLHLKAPVKIQEPMEGIKRPEFQTSSTTLKDNCESLPINPDSNNIVNVLEYQGTVNDEKDFLESGTPVHNKSQDSLTEIQEHRGGTPDVRISGGASGEGNSNSPADSTQVSRAANVQGSDDLENFLYLKAPIKLLEQMESIKRPEFQTLPAPMKDNFESFTSHETCDSNIANVLECQRTITDENDLLESRTPVHNKFQDSFTETLEHAGERQGFQMPGGASVEDNSTPPAGSTQACNQHP